MTESEPSAPLPVEKVRVGLAIVNLQADLAAAIRRAEGAEADAEVWLDCYHSAGSELDEVRGELDQARAQLAKVRAIHHPVRVSSGGSSTTDREGNHRSTVTWATACSCTHNWEVRCATLAALDPVGVVGPWQKTP